MMRHDDGRKPAAGRRVGPARHRRVAGRGTRIVSACFTLALALGLCLLAYPSVSDWWNRMHQSLAVAAYVKESADLSQERREALLEVARAYNERLAAGGDRWHPGEAEHHEYEAALDAAGTGMMGYLTIPSLDVDLPIYHGTSDAVLQIGAGHLEGSSLPVGGPSTHAVVSGHTGLPSAQLLTGLDELREGDTFAFHVLGETMTYEVDRISVVLPDALDELEIEDGRDYATLVTCTPYGVNTHRLLVRGHRIANPDEDAADAAARPSAVPMAAVVAGALGVLGAVGAGAAVALAVRRRRRDTGSGPEPNNPGRSRRHARRRAGGARPRRH